MNRTLRSSADELTRRAFLSRLAFGVLGVSALPLIASPTLAAISSDAAPSRRRPTAKNVIYLYMAGGMSHLDTFDPKPDNATVAGPLKAIPTNADGIQISEYLPLLAQQMHRVAIVRSLSSTQGAHEQGNYFMHTSFQQRGTIRHPALGAWMLRFSERINKTLPGNIVIGGGSNYAGGGYLDSEFAPLLIGKAAEGLAHSHAPNGVDEARYQRRLKVLESINEDFAAKHQVRSVKSYSDVYADALRLMKSPDLKAYDITEEPQEVRDAYGSEPFAQGCLLARRLVEHGVRYVEVAMGGWDTHDDNFDRVADQAAVLDQALSNLLIELAERGMLDETLVVVATEFGRSPEINQNQGRDHYPKAFSCMLAGGGVRGGTAYGKTNETGGTVVENKVEVPDFNATLAYALGLPTDEIVVSPSGRPFTLADKGKPITALFA